MESARPTSEAPNPIFDSMLDPRNVIDLKAQIDLRQSSVLEEQSLGRRYGMDIRDKDGSQHQNKQDIKAAIYGELVDGYLHKGDPDGEREIPDSVRGRLEELLSMKFNDLEKIVNDSESERKKELKEQMQQQAEVVGRSKWLAARELKDPEDKAYYKERYQQDNAALVSLFDQYNRDLHMLSGGTYNTLQGQEFAVEPVIPGSDQDHELKGQGLRMPSLGMARKTKEGRAVEQTFLGEDEKLVGELDGIISEVESDYRQRNETNKELRSRTLDQIKQPQVFIEDDQRISYFDDRLIHFEGLIEEDAEINDYAPEEVEFFKQEARLWFDVYKKAQQAAYLEWLAGPQRMDPELKQRLEEEASQKETELAESRAKFEQHAVRAPAEKERFQASISDYTEKTKEGYEQIYEQMTRHIQDDADRLASARASGSDEEPLRAEMAELIDKFQKLNRQDADEINADRHLMEEYINQRAAELGRDAAVTEEIPVVAAATEEIRMPKRGNIFTRRKAKFQAKMDQKSEKYQAKRAAKKEKRQARTERRADFKDAHKQRRVAKKEAKDARKSAEVSKPENERESTSV